MEKIPSTVVIHKNLDGVDTIFSAMSIPLIKNPLVKWLIVIIIGSYQAEAEERRWEYEPVSDLCTDIEPDSDSSVDDSID